MSGRAGLAALAALALALAAWVGWRAGLGRIPPSETAIIEAAARAYAAETGGARTDCYGLPGEPPVRIVVVCEGAARRVYRLDTHGAVLDGEDGT